MNQKLLIIFLLFAQLCIANMASPVRKGTFSSAAFSSRNINIIKEKIYLTINKDSNSASYIIEYFIKSEAEGNQIPLLFHAKDYKGDFKIWVDNKVTKLMDIPAEYRTVKDSPFESFSRSFNSTSNADMPQSVIIYWEKHSGINYELKDLKYFETDLTKGEHVIRVEYAATAWTDVSGWVKEYSFRYSLSPAKFWKSFDSLQITIDALDNRTPLTTNLGKPAIGKLDSVAVWYFNKLPAEFIIVSYTPEISSFAKKMIAIDPFGLTVILFFIIAVIHFLLMKKYRIKNPAKKTSWVLIIGIIVIPFIILVFYIMSYDVIDSIIGINAGKHHGYTFLVIILYPVLLPIYGLFMWVTDRLIIKSIQN